MSGTLHPTLMLKMAVILLALVAGCGADPCETNHCDPCPGARREGSVEQPGSGNLAGFTERFCDCPISADGQDRGGGIAWRSCPANPDGTSATCADVLSAWKRACR